MKTGIALSLFVTISLSACTPNSAARHFGATTKIELEAGQKLVNVTWKEDSLWTLTRKFRDGEIPETYAFKEDSKFGLLEGKVIIMEKK